MRKILVAIAGVVAVVIAAIVVWSFLPTYGSTEPRTVEGSWTYKIEDQGGSSTGMGELTVITATSQGTWQGPFEGTSTSFIEMEAKSSGAATFEETVSLEGSVEVETGKRSQGTLEILYAGERQDRESDFVGTWEIVAGEGDLANLRGSGTFTSEPNSYVVDYSGEIHFE